MRIAANMQYLYDSVASRPFFRWRNRLRHLAVSATISLGILSGIAWSESSTRSALSNVNWGDGVEIEKEEEPEHTFAHPGDAVDEGSMGETSRDTEATPDGLDYSGSTDDGKVEIRDDELSEDQLAAVFTASLQPVQAHLSDLLAPDYEEDAIWIEDALAANAPAYWQWQLLPRSLIYRSYLAGAKEPRMRLVWAHERDAQWIWDVTLGARAGLIRFGEPHDGPFPQGWQLDIEGAAFPRLDTEADMDLVSSDFRFGVPLTWGVGHTQWKFGYYHLSSHLGDELIFREGLTERFNFSRDTLVVGVSCFITPDVRLYGEAGWAFYSDISEPWEFQFGFDYSPAGPTWIYGAPFAAVNAHLRQELDFSGHFVVQAGWQWRRRPAGGLLRVGLEYFNGHSEQFALFNQFEEKIGLGMWYDF